MAMSPRRSGRRMRLPTEQPVEPARKTIRSENIAGPDGDLTLLDQAGGVVHLAPPPVTESLRYMLARSRLGGGELPDRLGFTSALRGEGVTFVCRSLALVLTNDAASRVCIVDLNWWAPSGWPGDEERAGISDVIDGSVSLEQALVTTGNPGLQILPAGATTVMDRPVLANSPDIEKILLELSETFDHVLLDLPAVHATSEALTLAENCGSIAMVVNQGVTPADQVKSALDELSGVPVLGVILNKSSTRVPRLIRRRIPGA
jgi:Mrp family chromosome partitioning ATPase